MPLGVAEEMGGRIGAFDVDHAQVRLLRPPQLEADVAIAAGGGVGPFEMPQIVLEIKRLLKLFAADVDESREFLPTQIADRRTSGAIRSISSGGQVLAS